MWTQQIMSSFAVLQGFGGITSGVIREAAHTAQRPALKPDLALLAAVSPLHIFPPGLQLFTVCLVMMQSASKLAGTVLSYSRKAAMGRLMLGPDLQL